jgi:hypothetical protein
MTLLLSGSKNRRGRRFWSRRQSPETQGHWSGVVHGCDIVVMIRVLWVQCLKSEKLPPWWEKENKKTKDSIIEKEIFIKSDSIFWKEMRWAVWDRSLTAPHRCLGSLLVTRWEILQHRPGPVPVLTVIGLCRWMFVNHKPRAVCRICKVSDVGMEGQPLSCSCPPPAYSNNWPSRKQAELSRGCDFSK